MSKNKDIRLAVNFADHPKVVKLRRKLGADGVLAWICLLCFAGANKPSGLFDGMDDEELAIAAKWDGGAAKFTSALLECRLLEDTGGAFKLHDWTAHNGFAANFDNRSTAARNAINSRWEKVKRSDPNRTTDGYEQNNGSNGTVLQTEVHPEAKRNTPSPFPSPLPVTEGKPSGAAAPTEPPVAWIIRKNGQPEAVYPSHVSQWLAEFPGVDVTNEVRRICEWSRGKPRPEKDDLIAWMRSMLAKSYAKLQAAQTSAQAEQPAEVLGLDGQPLPPENPHPWLSFRDAAAEPAWYGKPEIRRRAVNALRRLRADANLPHERQLHDLCAKVLPGEVIDV